MLFVATVTTILQIQKVLLHWYFYCNCFFFLMFIQFVSENDRTFAWRLKIEDFDDEKHSEHNWPMGIMDN